MARSYGRSEEFLADWLKARPGVGDVVVGGKWGCTYTADWRTDAEQHEVKDHSVATCERQCAESSALLGARLASHLQAATADPDEDQLAQLEALAEDPHAYWERRARLPWH